MRTAVLSTLLILVPGLALAQVPQAQARTDAFVAALKRVKAPVKSDADRTANEKVFAELDGFLDFDALTVEAIRPRADKFTAEQKADYAKKFRELIRLIAYPNSGEFFSRAKLTFKAPKAEGGRTDVPFNAKDPKDDLESDVTLHWVTKGADLRLVDVSFDGESLVKDYQNQFARIVDKDGVAGLIKKLDERRADLAKQQAAGTSKK